MTTGVEIGVWFDRGVQQGASHMFIVCDTFDWDDYPVYAATPGEATERASRYPAGMQKLMEVYDLSMDRDSQIKAGRVFNLPITQRAAT